MHLHPPSPQIITATATLCGLFFALWQQRLSREPGIWTIRDLSSGLLWRNTELMRWLEIDTPTDTWRNALLWTRYEDVPVIEDACSAALKLGKPQRLRIKMKTSPHTLTDVDVKLFASKCSCPCPHQCALIIFRSCALPQPHRPASPTGDSLHRDH
jgi:hypothetical protein